MAGVWQRRRARRLGGAGSGVNEVLAAQHHIVPALNLGDLNGKTIAIDRAYPKLATTLIAPPHIVDHAQSAPCQISITIANTTVVTICW